MRLILNIIKSKILKDNDSPKLLILCTSKKEIYKEVFQGMNFNIFDFAELKEECEKNKNKTLKFTDVQKCISEDYDAAICIDFLRYSSNDEKIQIIEMLSNKIRDCYISLKGSQGGFSTLSTFFYSLAEMGKIKSIKSPVYLCTAWNNGYRYQNIKRFNILGGRAVFLKSKGNEKTVVKRELKTFGHYWIHTDISHESEIYQKVSHENFFPNFIGYREDDKFREMEIEYIKEDESITDKRLYEVNVNKIVDYFKKNNLVILDSYNENIIVQNNKIFIVDLESVFYRTDKNLFKIEPTATKWHRTEKSIEDYVNFCDDLKKMLYRRANG